MPTQADVSTQGLSPASNEAPLRRAPTLYAIIIFKIIKGILFLAFGVVLYFQASRPDLVQEWKDLLNQPVVAHIFETLRIHPENKFFQHIAEQIADLTEPRVRAWAFGTMFFSLFPLVEGFGMLYRAGWAGWLAIGESAFFVPIEMYELAKKFSPHMLVVMIINVLIVWYLYANRQTLFRHHHHKQ